MALYDTRYGLPQSMVDYLNQGLPSIYQPPTVDPIDSQPIEDEEDQVLEELYPQNYQGGGDGYSVYNPDPNMTRTSRNYVNPFPYDPMDDFGTSDYGYIEEPRKGIPGLFDQYIKTSLPAQLLGKGFNFLKDQLPVNKAGIFQNELLGAGFMLDNTGRIVANDYNTPTGIMAGYNPVSGGLLNMLTGGEKGEPATYGLDKSYDKRRETIAKTLKEKYGMLDEDIQAAIAGEYTGETPVDKRFNNRPTDLINRLNLLNQSQNLLNKRKSAAEVIFDRKVEERQKEKQRAAAEEAAQQRSFEKAAAAKRNIQQYTGGGGGGGRDRSPSQRQREAGPGFSGSGSAAEMGSF